MSHNEQTDISHKRRLIEKLKDKKVASVDRLRKLQIKSANQLFEYEIAEIENVYHKAIEDIEEECKEKFAHRNQKTKTFSVESDEAKTTRQLRSTLSSADVVGSDNKSSQSLKSKKRSFSATVNVTSLLEKSIPELSSRSDFLEIVRDLQSQAALINNCDEIDMIVAEDCSEIIIGNVAFQLGDIVQVYSVVSKQSFTGSITNISTNYLIIHPLNGLRLRILIDQIQRRRVLISKEKQ